MKSLTLIDAGTGNLRSVQKALESVGASVTLTSDPDVVAQGGRVVLPGVGAFGDFMDGLRARNLEEPVLDVVHRGDPMLGICVGMQAFFEYGLEMGKYAGLGILPGEVVRFPNFGDLKVPHTGWNQLWPAKPAEQSSTLLAGLDNGAYVYFNHSYYCAPSQPSDVVANTDYGFDYASMVQRDNVFGVQFHPEKSQRVGMSILRNFLDLT